MVSIFTIAALLRPIVDFGLVVLIWLVQLIIYPSFQHCDPERFQQWHNHYTNLILLFVGPLMLGQIAILGAQLLVQPSLSVIASCLTVAFIWGWTYFVSIPNHTSLSSNGYEISVINRLIQTNWPRTIAWTLCFVFSFKR